MKLLHDFSLLRFPRQLLAGRRASERSSYRVTVPAPLHASERQQAAAAVTRDSSAGSRSPGTPCVMSLRAGSAIPLSLRQ